MIKQVPSIQHTPETVHDNAVHYGYCAFKDIVVADRTVQPEHSPYRRLLPARELLPFTNLLVPEYIPELTGTTSFVRTAVGKDPTVRFVPKSARECVKELEWAYEEWGFVTLYSLTGLSEDDAFQVFATCQPFPYKLIHLVSELEDAESRINQTSNYTVSYDGEEYELAPLRSELKDVARKVLANIRSSADVGQSYAQGIADKTTESMNRRFSGGDGKASPDPRDRYVFAELETKMPQLVTSESSGSDLSKLADAILSRQQVDPQFREKEAELDQALAEVRAMKAQMDMNLRMEKARAGRGKDKAVAV